MRGRVSWMTKSQSRVQDAAPVTRAFSRWRRLALPRRLIDRNNLPLLALAGVVVGMTVLIGRIAVTNHHVFIDEFLAINFGRSIAQDFSLVDSNALARGPERLVSLITALTVEGSDSPTQQMWLLHAVMALCQGLVAVPVWLAGRELGLSRWAAVVAAAIAASGTFAIYGVTTLNQSVGLLCATTMLWAMVRAMRRPGLASDLLVLAALAATALARLGWAPLVVALVPGALAAGWFERPVDEALSGWLRALPARLARRHPVLVPVLALAILVAVISGPSSLLGGEHYGEVALDAQIELDTLWDNARRHFSHLAIGLALVPFILAVPLLMRDLARPADATSGGFAWMVLGLLVVFSYVHYTAVTEDRYLAVLAPPLALAGVLAVFRRPPPVWAVLVSGLLTARLVATSYAWPPVGPYDFFIAPTSLFFERIVVGNLLGRLPFLHGNRPTIALLAALAAALVVAAVARRPKLRTPVGLSAAAFVLCGVLAFQIFAAEYPARKFVEAVGMPDVPTKDINFIDRAADGGRVEPLAVDGVVDRDLFDQLFFLRTYNRTLGTGMAVIRGPLAPGAPGLPPLVVQVDWRTGDADVTGEVPDLMLEKPGFNGVGFSGNFLSGSTYYPFAALERLQHPLEILWIARGDSVGGYPQRGRPIRLRVFPPTGRRTCVQGLIAVNPTADRPSRYRIVGALDPLRGVVQPGAPREFTARVPGGRPKTLVLRGAAGRLPDGSLLGPSLFNLTVAECT
jgi:hypothetical protein